MYNLKDFVEYNGQSFKPEDIILVWSKSSGYIFIVSKFATKEFNIVAIES